MRSVHPNTLNAGGVFQCSSASRKFLNSVTTLHLLLFLWFQCSSASRKFLNSIPNVASTPPSRFQCSSASRKFLNYYYDANYAQKTMFQCSSASRKFLNCARKRLTERGFETRFSALQRAENSSMAIPNSEKSSTSSFSALQRAENSSLASRWRSALTRSPVSVLFSEPKIPQSPFFSSVVRIS